MQLSTLSFPRRIITSNLPLEARFVDILNAKPAVRVISEDITPVPLLDGEAAKCPVFTHQIFPTFNNEP
jgi:hypothetical protein